MWSYEDTNIEATIRNKCIVLYLGVRVRLYKSKTKTYSSNVIIVELHSKNIAAMCMSLTLEDWMKVRERGNKMSFTNWYCSSRLKLDFVKSLFIFWRIFMIFCLFELFLIYLFIISHYLLFAEQTVLCFWMSFGPLVNQLSGDTISALLWSTITTDMVLLKSLD